MRKKKQDEIQSVDLVSSDPELELDPPRSEVVKHANEVLPSGGVLAGEEIVKPPPIVEAKLPDGGPPKWPDGLSFNLEIHDSFKFKQELREGICLERATQTVVNVLVDDRTESAFIPTKGRVGNIMIGGRPCLIRQSRNPDRKTKWTLLAISLDKASQPEKSWIGISENDARYYTLQALRRDAFSNMVYITTPDDVYEKKWCGMTRVDFMAKDTAIVMFMPLSQIEWDVPDWVKKKNNPPPHVLTEWNIRQMVGLADGLKGKQRGVVLMTFMYDAPEFAENLMCCYMQEYNDAIQYALRRGVETWQANFEITKTNVRLLRYFQLGVGGANQLLRSKS